MLRPVGASAGLHVLGWLPDDIDEAALIARTALSGVAVDGVTPYRVGSIGPGGLLFGYGSVPESRIEEGVRLIARAVAEVRSGNAG